MIVVTGGLGFIGSNLVHALNARGREDLIVVDDFTDGRKIANLREATIGDYHDRRDFLARFERLSRTGTGIELVYHLGACSDTTEWDGRRMMDDNFVYSRDLLDLCEVRGIPFVYASSAAVYGLSARCVEEPRSEAPLNVYGYSKLAFDQHVRQRLGRARSRIVGLRYFNVYGPREQHKGRMASVVLHFDDQLKRDGVLRLFGASHGVGPGEQRRDFIHVDDVVAQTLWCGETAGVTGVYNCGTGVAASFNEVARAVVAWHGRGEIEYIPFPTDLLGAYQAHTLADLERTRAAGYRHRARAVDVGVRDYLDWLNP
ncbi:MAG: ADP-glyceromanno-heptose 6-epimerase [Gammaproteobacteria bacterium]